MKDLPIVYLGDESEDVPPHIEVMKAFAWGVLAASIAVILGVGVGLALHLSRVIL